MSDIYIFSNTREAIDKSKGDDMGLKKMFEDILAEEDNMGNAIQPGIDATLAERGNRYGDFQEHARITQNIKRAMRDSPNWESLSDDKKEALEMDAHKIGRILNGDPEYKDSWHDVIGYTKLVENTLND